MNGLPEGFAVEPMREAHLSAVAEMEKECFSKPWSPGALREEMENPLAAFFVAVCGGEPVGYAGMNFVLDEGYIDNIAVSPRFRRRGVATALLRRLQVFALQSGLAFLTLEVRASNAGAIGLYERFGFRRAGLRRGFYDAPKEDGVIMTKFLEKTETEYQQETDVPN